MVSAAWPPFDVFRRIPVTLDPAVPIGHLFRGAGCARMPNTIIMSPATFVDFQIEMSTHSYRVKLTMRSIARRARALGQPRPDYPALERHALEVERRLRVTC